MHHRDPVEATISCFCLRRISEVSTKLCPRCFPGWRPKQLCGFVGRRRPRPSRPISQATPFEGRVSRQVSWTSRSAPSTRTGPVSNSSYVSKTVRRPGESERRPASFCFYSQDRVADDFRLESVATVSSVHRFSPAEFARCDLNWMIPAFTIRLFRLPKRSSRVADLRARTARSDFDGGETKLAVRKRRAWVSIVRGRYSTSGMLAARSNRMRARILFSIWR